MSKVVQEKFQVDMPFSEGPRPKSESWVTDTQARAKKNMPGREGLPGGDSNSRFSDLNAMFNTLPPGMDIEDQEVSDIRRMGMSFNGNNPIDGAAGDVTRDVTPTSLRTGFDRKKLLNTDDAYTREHNDAFYDDMVVDGDVGFVERNNMLDRM